ncbi:MAG TPA: DUF3883 domain-containing protein [Tianweitania sediminis]|nr:DUF3883 domain-containing protein [Tianweitania sediminis]
MKKVLWVKFAWSDYYRGGPVDGNFGWLKGAKGDRATAPGHEAFNFMPIRGTYYCYVPPQSKHHAPANEDDTGWTVICLAKNPKHPGVHIVGWYEDATLMGTWLAPPPANPAGDQRVVGSAYDWSYCIKSKSAFFVPPEHRTAPFSHSSVRQGKYSFLTGPDVTKTARKSELLRILEKKLVALRLIAVRNPSEKNVPDPELDAADPLTGFGTPEHRKKVEKAAERAVIAFYEARGFVWEDRTKENCGYDFLFTKEGARDLHVEVKGTSGESPRFFLTRNEHSVGYEIDPAWRLAMVTRALAEKPVVEIFDAAAVRRAFDLTPYVYIASRVVAPEAL